MIEHDRNSASQQAGYPEAGYPASEDRPRLGAFQHVAGRDLTRQPYPRDRDALPV
jgi:hypothetical protein